MGLVILVQRGAGYVSVEDASVTSPGLLSASDKAKLNALPAAPAAIGIIFYLDDGPVAGYKETTPFGAAFSTAQTWYTDSTKTKKVVELLLTLNLNNQPTTEVWNLYAADGATISSTVTDTITYQNAFEATRTRTLS